MKKKSSDPLEELFSKETNIKADIVPMIDEGDEEVLLNANGIGNEMPVLPIMEQVLFPGVIIPIALQREKSRRMMADVSRSGGEIAVFTQCNDADDPTTKDLFSTGVVARVMKVFTVHHDTTVAVLQGVVRCIGLHLTQEEPYMVARIELKPESTDGMKTASFGRKEKLLRKSVGELMDSLHRGSDMGSLIASIGSKQIFVNFVATHLDIDTGQKQLLLECDSIVNRVDRMIEFVDALKSVDELRKEIDDKTRQVLENQQREIYLRNQLNIIQQELGGPNSGNTWFDSEVETLRQRGELMDWPKAAKEQFEHELAHLTKIQPMSSDYNVQVSYLEALLELPWNHNVDENYDIDKAQHLLDRDHYGIDKVKKRIVEYIAILGRQRERGLQSKAQVLCLVGPPGTGKTSICRSIAAALGRPYRRVALGGLHDEAEIRGHRRTYVGAMPGRILQEIRKAGASNPVFVLDEIDKVQSRSYNGDPASALLEVLDPEQNCHFYDNFVGVDYDLSRVFFIATANSVADIQPALLDRMEVIDFNGYVQEEKLEIAKRHLLPRLMKENVVDRRSNRFPDPILKLVIDEYTREGGVRQLDKQLSKLVRHRAVANSRGDKLPASLTEAEVREVLGLPIHNSERARHEAREGIVTGLAWTPVGGEILFIEASLSKGKGTLSMTGNLGDVMKESATLAFEYIKSNHTALGIDQAAIDESNVHIHVPEGATPKDGPSAGVTMFTAMVSAFTHRRVRPDVAMTGEITLRGDVTPVGGIKEKILAAKRAGITTLVLCDDNRRDIDDIEPRYLDGLQFHYVTDMSQVLPLALIQN